MTLYFDLDAGIFVSGPGTRDRIDALSFKRGDTCRIDLRFVSGITVQELAVGATGQIGLKESGQYDADFVAAATSWTKTGTGTSTVYSFDLNLATTELNALLGDDGTDGNDMASVALMFELEFVEDGVTTSSPTLTATVYNDVIKGDETGPTDITEGTPTNIPTSLTVTGTLTDGASAVVFPTLYPVGPSDPETIFTATGDPVTDSGTEYIAEIGLGGSPVGATIRKNVEGVTVALWKCTADVYYFEDVTAWVADSDETGTPLVTVTPSTPGRAGSMKVDADYLYVAASATAGVPRWKKIALTAL